MTQHLNDIQAKIAVTVAVLSAGTTMLAACSGDWHAAAVGVIATVFSLALCLMFTD